MAQGVSYAFLHSFALTESLAEAGADRVKRLTKHIEWYAGLYSNVPDAGTIKMHFDAALVCVFRNADDLILWKYRSIECVF